MRENIASCPGEFSLVGMWGNSDRYYGFFGGCSDCFSIDRAGPCRKVEGEYYIASFRINASFIEIRGCAKILLDDTQYPVLIRSLNLFWFFKSFAPFRGETIQCQALSFKD